MTIQLKGIRKLAVLKIEHSILVAVKQAQKGLVQLPNDIRGQ